MIKVKQIAVRRTAALVFSIAVVSGCSVIEPLPGSEAVNLITEDQARNCKLMGEASAQVLDKIGFIERQDDPVEKNLETLGKNEAVKLGGNAILPLGDIEEGTRRFAVYLCK